MNWRNNQSKRIILDNGSSTIRMGTAATEQPVVAWRNLVGIDKVTGAKMIGDQLNHVWSETKMIYYRPNVRGVTMKFDHELTLWEEMLKKIQSVEQKKTGYDLSDCSLTFPMLPCVPISIQQRYFEIFFEHFNFEAVMPCHSSTLLYEKAKKDYSSKSMKQGYELSNRYSLVVESSESGTYYTPYIEGEIQMQGLRKMDVGGKLLTSWLKQLLSFRHLDLKDSDMLIKQIKQELCYVSWNMSTDMRSKKGQHAKHFILPDEELMKRGYSSDEWDPSNIFLKSDSYAQKITLDKERFQIPQILFNPQDIGLEQSGLVQSIMESINFSEEDIRHNFLQNIVISGGNFNIPNIRQRLYRDLRENCPTWIKPRLYCMCQNNEVFESAVDFTRKSSFVDRVYTKNFYKENGIGRFRII